MITWQFRPPAIDPRARIHAVADLAEAAMADELLAQSQPLVPVEDGIMKASGRVVRTETAHAVTYGEDDDGVVEGGKVKHAPSNQYVVKQHEDSELHHPHGGQWKFLETPMHSAHEAILGAGAVELKRAFE